MILSAQTQVPLTLEDLFSSGTNYWSLQPPSRYFDLCGDMLLEKEVDRVLVVSRGGKTLKTPEVLFTADDVRPLIADTTEGRGLNLLRTSFPNADKSEALLATSKSTFLYDWKAKRITWQGAKPNGRTQYSEFNSASNSRAFVQDYNLFLTTADGTTHQISTDGSREVPYGLSVHRDEFGITKGTFFSPSGRRLAFYKMDQSMVTDYPQVDIFPRVAEERPDKYPMAGMTSHKVYVGVYTPATRSTVWLQTGDPTDRYFTNIAWSPDEKTIYMAELPRTQDKAELVAYDAATGQRKGVLYTEENAKYVEPQTPIVFLPWDADKFLLQSQRDGFNHFYLFDTKGQMLKQLTQGEWVVLQLLGFDEKTKSIIYTSTERSALNTNVYRLDVATGKRTLLDSGEGVSYPSLAQGGRFILNRNSSPTTYRTVSLIDTRTGKTEVLQKDDCQYAGYEMPAVETGTITAADGRTPLHYRLVKPLNFDPSQKYPTVVYVYGGPHAQNVDASWQYGSRAWETYMAEKGYVIFVLDNRGSSNRGFEFESATFRHLGTEEMKDQICGVDFLKSLPYVDANRLGVHGWSFGGFMTTNLMCTYPDVFKVGVAGGPVIDWKYYEVMYGERYMDTPQENPDGYREASLLNKADKLKGKLQIIFGYNDPTCVPQHTLSFLAACIKAGTQPDLFTYPGEGHNMAGHARIHLHERITQYFEDYLKPIGND